MRVDGGADSVGVGYRVGSDYGLAGTARRIGSRLDETREKKKNQGLACKFGDGGLNGFSGFMALNVYSIYHFATT